MKQTFFQYNMKKNGSIDNIMKNGIIVLDANALLNIYRFNNVNREKYFEILNVVKDRLFLTYQTVQEFYNNRLTIIYNKSKFKEDLKQELNKKITEINNILENNNFQSENKDSCNLIKHEQILKDGLIDILNKAKIEIEDKINSYSIDIDKTFISDDDPIIDKILEIFDGKISSAFTKDDLEKIYKLGKERYEAKVPPGYEDIKRKPEPECYGDLIIWKEMINISKDKKKDILFVSDDRKPDWCEKFKGSDLGPRKELIKEFFNETNQKFYSSTTEKFIKYISDLHTIKDTTELEIESAVIEKDLLKSSALDDIRDIKLNSNVQNILSQINELKINPALVSVLDDVRNLKLSLNAQNVLSQFDGLKVNPALVSVLDDVRNPKLSLNAQNVLSQFDGLKVNPALVSVLDDVRNLKLSLNAQNVLSQFDGLKVNPALVSVLDDARNLKLSLNAQNVLNQFNGLKINPEFASPLDNINQNKLDQSLLNTFNNENTELNDSKNTCQDSNTMDDQD